MALNDHIFITRVINFVRLVANRQEPIFPEVLNELLLVDCLRGEVDHAIVVLIGHDMIGSALA